MSKIFIKHKKNHQLDVNIDQYLNIITCTFNRPGRITYLNHLKSLLDNEKNIRWFVVDDNDQLDTDLSDFLPDYAIHLYCGPTRDKGHAQRNMALEYIKDNNFDGTIYNADDDNKFDPAIFNELRKNKHISILPVGNLPTPKGGSERPILVNGKFKSWNSFWHRKFPVDMAGFCFNASLLKDLKKPLWKHKGVGGESEFLSKIARNEQDLTFLCEDCSKTYVWHNELLSIPYISAKQTINIESKEQGPRFGQTSGTQKQYEEIKQKIFTNATDSDIKLIEDIFIGTDGVFNSPDRAELCAIAQEVSKIESGHIVEIGCWRGRTTTILAKFKQKNSHLFVVDHFNSHNGLINEPKTKQENLQLFQNTIKKFDIENQLTIIEQDSTTISWNKYCDKKQKISCIFYDGDPALLSIKKTILNMVPYMTNDCTIIFHDASWRDHQSFVNTLCTKYDFNLDTYINIWEGLVILKRDKK